MWVWNWQVGPRLTKDRERFPPNNVLLMLAGAGLLWLGWAGFNGGDPYAANVDSSIAVINTNICAATSLLVWTLMDVLVFGKPSVIGAVQGMITGLVVITPAAGNQSSQHPLSPLRLKGVLNGYFFRLANPNQGLPATFLKKFGASYEYHIRYQSEDSRAHQVVGYIGPILC